MAEAREVERWLGEHGISCVRLEAINHDGLVLGKYLAPAKLLAALEKGSLFADTCFGVDSSGEVERSLVYSRDIIATASRSRST